VFIQELQPAPLGVQGHTPSPAPSSSQQQQHQRVVSQLLAGASLEEINPEEALVEKTLLAIQDKVSYYIVDMAGWILCEWLHNNTLYNYFPSK
jgi:hypothetical protein